MIIGPNVLEAKYIQYVSSSLFLDLPNLLSFIHSFPPYQLAAVDAKVQVSTTSDGSRSFKELCIK